MTIEQVRNRIDVIEAMAHDDEAAHSLEDQLRSDFIRHVAWHSETREIGTMAELILTTDDIKFDRSCA